MYGNVIGFNYFFNIYLLLPPLGLYCWAGYSPLVVCRLLIAVAILAAERKLQGMWPSLVVAHRLRSCGSQAPERRFNSCGTLA